MKPQNFNVGGQQFLGRVSQQPYPKASQQVISVGPVLIKTNRFPGYFYGQKLQITGRFKKKVINPFQIQYFAYYPTIRVPGNSKGI